MALWIGNVAADIYKPQLKSFAEMHFGPVGCIHGLSRHDFGKPQWAIVDFDYLFDGVLAALSMPQQEQGHIHLPLAVPMGMVSTQLLHHLPKSPYTLAGASSLLPFDV